MVVDAEDRRKRTTPLFGASGEVCSEKAQNELDRVSIVRDGRLSDLSGVTKSGRRNWSDDFKSSHTNVENWGFANPRTGKPNWPGRVQENWLITAATWESVGSAGTHRQTRYNAAALAPGVA